MDFGVIRMCSVDSLMASLVQTVDCGRGCTCIEAEDKWNIYFAGNFPITKTYLKIEVY